jgi:hypothetical protein
MGEVMAASLDKETPQRSALRSSSTSGDSLLHPRSIVSSA